jgi:uncharacterized protein YjbI with pentapeptide repeats
MEKPLALSPHDPVPEATPETMALAKLDPETVQAHFQALQQLQPQPFELELQLINTARDWHISLEDCRRLWDYFLHHQATAANTSRLHRRNIWETVKGCTTLVTFLGQLSLLFGAILFISEADKRQREARNQAWQVINNIQPTEITASAGRIEALDSLNRGCTEDNTPPWGLSRPQWQQWRRLAFIKGFYAECVNLTGLNLQGAQLATIQLPWAQLQRANLDNINLDQANLRFADLQSTRLNRAQMAQADLTGANLSNAHLSQALLVGSKLRKTNFFKADLSLADLRGADLRGANLINANLYGTNLKGAIYDQQTQPFAKLKTFLQNVGAYFIDNKEKTQTNLVEANLGGVDLSGTNLRDVDLSRANLGGASLQRAHLENTLFKKANLRGADLREAQLNQQTNFAGSTYDAEMAAHFPRQWRFLLNPAYKIEPQQNLTGADLQGADLRQANLSQSILKQANLKQADLRGANLMGTDLTNAQVHGALYDVTTQIPPAFVSLFERQAYNLDYQAHLAGADLSGLNLENSNLVMATLTTAKLNRTNLQGSNLFGANLAQAQLRQAVIKQAKLMEANLSGANLEGANLSESSLLGAKLQGANLHNAILQGVDLTGADLRGAQGLTVGKIQAALHWQKAQFDPDFLQQLNKPTTVP